MIELSDNDKNTKLAEQRFDILVAVLGFETRARYIATQLEGQYDKGVCFAFQNRQDVAFEENRKFYQSLDFEIVDWQDDIECSDIGTFLAELCAKIDRTTQDNISIAIDVSSMTRSMSAKIIYALINILDIEKPYQITILYAPAKFSAPKAEQSQIKVAGPVIPEYSGWTLYPELPTYAVLGLGYEYGKALGALDYLDVSDTILFRPLGNDEKFVEAVNEVNDDLIQMVGCNHVMEYEVNDPYDTFIKLRSLISGLQRNGRVILIPFGPKIFHVMCLILAETFQSDLSVWRISPGDKEIAVDSEANGHISSFIFHVIQEEDVD